MTMQVNGTYLLTESWAQKKLRHFRLNLLGLYNWFFIF